LKNYPLKLGNGFEKSHPPSAEVRREKEEGRRKKEEGKRERQAVGGPCSTRHVLTPNPKP